MTLPSTSVICTAPLTDPQTSRLDLIFLIVNPANGSPSTAGIDISTTHRRRFVSELDEVACAAEDGRMMCWPVMDEMATDLEDEKDGLRTLLVLLLEDWELISKFGCCTSKGCMLTPLGGVSR